LETLRAAIEAGHWYSTLDENANFQPLRASSEFHHLVTLCAQRRAEEIAKAQPVLKIMQPNEGLKSQPVLFALHGNSSNVEAFAPYWQQAVTQGWLVVLPQSPQMYGPGRHAWNDWDWVIPTLVEQYTQVCKSYRVDSRKAVLAGFSMGAGLALWLALERTIEVRGVIAIAPFLSNVEALQSMLADQRNRNQRIYLVASHEDEYCYDVAVQLSTLLPQYGIEHKLDIYSDAGHAFPPSFEHRIPAALDFILNG
jgi:predicted esterase